MCCFASQIYVNENANPKAADVIKNVFLTISSKFGHGRPFEVVFELFGEFEKGQHDVLFDVRVFLYIKKQCKVGVREKSSTFFSLFNFTSCLLRCLPFRIIFMNISILPVG